MSTLSSRSLFDLTNLDILHKSLVPYDDIEYTLARSAQGLKLVCMAKHDDPRCSQFSGEFSALGEYTLLIAEMTSANAEALRRQIPWLQPSLLDLRTSAGMGDRLGLATPGHVRAVRATGSKIAPIFAQQSIREMTRTHRTPQQVMDDALWGVFQESWRSGFGADADHLKTFDDIDRCLSAGFTFFTIDPGQSVDNRAETADLSELRELSEALPPSVLMESSDLLGRSVQAEGILLTFDEETLLKAMVKYGSAIDQVAEMYHHLESSVGERRFELEVSVDETDQPTSHAEHAYIAHELKRAGVKWVSLAPRFVGEFEKGVDYIGNLEAFEADIAGHAAIARKFGPYKLSLHSGSDKFSIYEIAMRQTQGLVHLKTAGTSYLEALRTIAALDEDLFREIYAFARERYETDKASYHVSAQLSRAPLPDVVHHPADLLDQFDAREIMHVTFGSVLDAKGGDGNTLFYDRCMDLLKTHAEAYAANLEKHFVRHLKPFSRE